MNITYTRDEDCVLEFKVDFSAEEWKPDFDKELASTVSTIKLDGFRPGKAPMPMIKARFGNEIFEKVIGKKLDGVFNAVSEEKNFVVDDRYALPLSPQSLNSGNLSFKCTLFRTPTVIVPDISDVVFDKYVFNVSDDSEEVEKRVQELLSSHYKYVEVTEEGVQIEAEDKVSFAFHLTEKDGHESRHDKMVFIATPYDDPDKAGNDVKEISNLFLGKKVGDTFEHFSKDTGATSKFEIKSISKREDLPLEELSRLAGADSYAHLRERVLKLLTESSTEETRESLNLQANYAIARRININMPKEVLDAKAAEYYEEMQDGMSAMLEKTGVQYSEDDIELLTRGGCTQKFRLELLTSQYAKANNIRADFHTILKLMNLIDSDFVSAEDQKEFMNDIRAHAFQVAVVEDIRLSQKCQEVEHVFSSQKEMQDAIVQRNAELIHFMLEDMKAGLSVSLTDSANDVTMIAENAADTSVVQEAQSAEEEEVVKPKKTTSRKKKSTEEA